MNSDPDRQIPLLTIGFRPFFLAAGIYGALAMMAWIAWLMLHNANAVVVSPTIAVAAHLWHGHEMIFGYASAVIAGFMLTAVPGWTGSRRVAGSSLLLLAAIWLAGRAVMWLSSFVAPMLVAAVDLAFLPVLAGFIGKALFRQFQARNAIFFVLIMILITGNLAVHGEWLGVFDNSASWGLELAVLDIALMISIIGGRIVPSFTRNAMIKRGDRQSYPRQLKPLDLLSVLSVAGVLLCWMLALPEIVTGAVALIAGLANLVRQSLWRPDTTLGEPILWILHAGYLWIAIGMGCLAGAYLFDVFSQSAALHVLGAGAIGSMTLAMMTRAPLGHTGRALSVNASIAVSYVMILAAALLRGFALDAMPEYYFEIIFLAGGLWIAGFTVYSIVYLPILVGPSLKPSPQE